MGLGLAAGAQSGHVSDQAVVQVPPGEAVPEGTQAGVVERVVDGDTIWVRIDEPGGPLAAGATHKIRLLEIDTPEMGGPGGAECGGPQATAFAQRHLLIGSTVHLLADREDTDRYGRFLRYVWTAEGMFFNAEAVRRGHARAVLFEPNDAYIDVMRAAEAEARAAGRGIWGEHC
jgi:micrococcal nuclease